MGFLTILYKYIIQQYLKQIKYQMLVVVHRTTGSGNCMSALSSSNILLSPLLILPSLWKSAYHFNICTNTDWWKSNSTIQAAFYKQNIKSNFIAITSVNPL